MRESFISRSISVNKEGMTDLEHYNFVTLNKVMDLGNDHQWLLNYTEKQASFMCPPEGSSHHYTLAKTPSLILPLAPMTKEIFCLHYPVL